MYTLLKALIMFEKYFVWILLSFFIVGSYAGDEKAFVKRDSNSFARVIEYNEPELPSTDFVLQVSKLLDTVKNGGVVTVAELNKFDEGLNQYYLSRAYEHYYLKVKPMKTFNLSDYKDPILLPNSSVTEYSDLFFEDVKVYGFPTFKNNYKVISEVTSSSPYFQSYEVKFTASSDSVIFTGNFIAYDNKYFFVYTTTTNAYVSEHIKVRTMDGLIKSNTSMESISFGQESLLHTYDSALEHFSEVNSSVFTGFASLLQRTYFPKLAENADYLIASKFFDVSIEFGQLYRKRVMELLLQSAIQYLKLKNLNSFEMKPIVFNNTVGNRVVSLSYENIKVEGILNFVKYEVTDSKKEAAVNSSETSFLQLNDTVTVFYGSAEGQEAKFSFTMRQSNRESTKTFKIKSFNITAAYEANVNRFPVEVFRNKNIFEPATGFMVKFELEDFTELYQFLIDHTGNGMSRIMDAVLLKYQFN